MKIISHLITTILFLGIVSLAPRIVHDSLADQAAKSDLAEINHIMYGIFSVNSWKGKISEIIYNEIRKIDLKQTTVKLRTTIENQLTAIIDKLNEQVREANKHSLGGRIKQTLIDLVVDMEVVKKGVPKYADAVIGEITKPETEKLVKDVATKQLRHYLSKTFIEQNMEPVNKVLERTGTQSVAEATAKLNGEIEGRRKGLTERSYALMGLTLLLFIWVGFPKNRSKYNFTVLFATLIVLLAIGVSIPMIDLEAKISEFSFTLVGNKITFENQILYFQSKSVINVFLLMIDHPDVKMKVVGILMVLFSIVIPVFKIAASMIFCYFEKTRSSRILNFLAFKTGKWSMADVLVIAILMAYIGFNGIVETQFSKMKALVPKDITFFTTNGTTLQMGFYIFLTYVLMALVVATYLHGDDMRKPVAKA
jgi:Paraquat-inducible protein A